ncbi:MAG: VRR-NUC domain-containing protein [Gammaproteobacteria bacterium]|nr:VRR-NUC domain-containing protein [Gammaproteobacteria bacterium]
MNDEELEQQKLVQWLKIKKLFYFAIPNGAFLSGTPLQRAKQMARLKSAGLVVGASDIVVMLPNKILFIELKRPKKILKSGKLSTSNSTVSLEQKKFLQAIVDNFEYAEATVCYGFNEAREFIEWHIK